MRKVLEKSGVERVLGKGRFQALVLANDVHTLRENLLHLLFINEFNSFNRLLRSRINWFNYKATLQVISRHLKQLRRFGFKVALIPLIFRNSLKNSVRKLLNADKAPHELETVQNSIERSLFVFLLCNSVCFERTET